MRARCPTPGRPRADAAFYVVAFSLLLGACGPGRPGATTETEVGSACTRPSECASGLCIATAGGISRCTAQCADTPCPDGWSCEAVAGVEGSICVCATCDMPMQPMPPMRFDAGPPRDGGAVPADGGMLVDSGADGGSSPIDAGTIEPIPCADEPLRTEPFVGPYEGRITAYYITPADQTLDANRARYFACSLREVAGFYRAQTGRTFTWAMAAVRSRRDTASFGCVAENNTCWERVLEELRALGVTPGAARTLFLVAVQGNYSYLAGSRGAGVDGGGVSVYGADLYLDMIERRCDPAECTSRIFSAVGEDGDGVAGGLAQVIGYGLGLDNTPTSSPDYTRSVMGEFWHYPRVIVTRSDLTTLRANLLLR